MEERLMSILNSHFNTSHVKVYPVFEHLQFLLHFISIHLMLRFILYHFIRYSRCDNFNTSHVKVYQKEGLWITLVFQNFNTSHVKVYRKVVQRRKRSSGISIHLMLRFIVTEPAILAFENNFNTSHVKVYLGFFNRQRHGSLDFNTSHVKVYLRISRHALQQGCISIHLMLRFIV